MGLRLMVMLGWGRWSLLEWLVWRRTLVMGWWWTVRGAGLLGLRRSARCTVLRWRWWHAACRRAWSGIIGRSLCRLRSLRCLRSRSRRRCLRVGRSQMRHRMHSLNPTLSLHPIRVRLSLRSVYRALCG